MKKPHRVLVVDDLADWRQTLSGLLHDEGFSVTTAANQEEALAALAAQRFDVAVLDVRLDETDERNRDGLYLMHIIRKQSPYTSIIILTGYADKDMVREALQPDEKGHSPAFGFLEKVEPDIKQLIPYVKRATGHHQPPDFEPSRECTLTVAMESNQKVIVRADGAVRFTHSSRNPLNFDIEKLRRRTDITKTRFLLKETGEQIYTELFDKHPVLANSYARALGRVTSQKYLHFCLQGEPELISIPLEFLYLQDERQYLALIHPLTRQIRGVVMRRSAISPDMVTLFTTGEKLRLLILVSNTNPNIDLIDQMGEQILQMLEPVDWLEVTLVRTREAAHARVQELLQSRQYQMVQYIGHGYFDESSPEQSGLLFWSRENRSGSPTPMTANQLRFLLQDSDVRLFHLTCCEGAQTGDAASQLDDDSLGIADAIIQAGVPSVLGYRWPVPAARARDFSLAFYRSFIQHGSPPLAVLEARKKLAMDDKDELTWVSPILISQD
ncbi:MAG: CHAT domain-containing protein [Anaerolineae bacterium]|nr:CHAT domain-containing protein [Anaerolineae bacterium]